MYEGATYGLDKNELGFNLFNLAKNFSTIKNVHCFCLFDCWRSKITIENIPEEKGKKLNFGQLTILYGASPKSVALGFKGRGSDMTNAFL